MLPVSRKTYWFDMDLANETGIPQWNLMTDWTSDYGMADLSPGSFKTMADQIEADEEFSTNFLNKSWKKNEAEKQDSCDQDCMATAAGLAKFIDLYRRSEYMGKPNMDW